MEAKLKANSHKKTSKQATSKNMSLITTSKRQQNEARWRIWKQEDAEGNVSRKGEIRGDTFFFYFKKIH